MNCVNVLEIAFDFWQHSNNDTFVQCNNICNISDTVYKVHISTMWQNLHECTVTLHDIHMYTYAMSYDNLHVYVDDHQQTLVNNFELQSNFDHQSDHLPNYK